MICDSSWFEHKIASSLNSIRCSLNYHSVVALFRKFPRRMINEREEKRVQRDGSRLKQMPRSRFKTKAELAASK